MRTLFCITIILCLIAGHTFAEQLSIETDNRHLKLYEDVSGGDDDGRIGRYIRSQTVQYSDEILCYADVSSLAGATITGVTFKFYINSIHTGGASNPGTAIIYEQNKGPYYPSGEYDSYTREEWNNPLGSKTLDYNSPSGFYEITSTSLKNIVQDWVDGTKENKGLIFGGDFGYYDYYWNVSVQTSGYRIKLTIEYIPANDPPYADPVEVAGQAVVDEVLTGSYTYHDADSDPEGQSIYKWYRADDAVGSNAQVITGATNQLYTITEADIDKFICFEVTPVAQTGDSPGLAVKSTCIGPVVGVIYSYPENCGEGENMSAPGKAGINKLANPA